MVCRAGHENDVVEKMRHSCAHVMADAVTSLFPKTKVTIGPCIDNGFYYDFDTDHPFTQEDLEKIEKKMEELISKNLPFIKKDISKKEAIEFFKNKGEKYKVEIIQDLPEKEAITLYQHGDFVDLCKGPHVESTGQIKAFKLLSVAGSYWRGNENREALQRIYGTAFSNPKDLRTYLAKIEEAKKRDHRKLGAQLQLFSFHPQAPASPFFLPHGTLIYNLLTDYLRALYKRDGYSEVITPQILDIDLWQTSGHLEHFKEAMFFTKAEEKEMAVKPMNCPGHCLLFKEQLWSYRDLPVRFADFGRLHRYERSGVTHGLTRVRTFTQDDAHIYCTPEQMGEEIRKFLNLVREVYDRFGFKEVHVALATRPESYIGTPEAWDKAELELKEALKGANLSFDINPGEGAFYGPKIEFQVKDAIDRPWQLGTLQIDYSMPSRFGLSYVDKDGVKKTPVMLHRAILGSMERFIGIMLEHCGGELPLWLAPIQVILLTITQDQNEFAKKVCYELEAHNLRVKIDDRHEKLGYKIREATLKKIPYMGILGEKEVAGQTISLRGRQGDLGSVGISDLIKMLATSG